MKPVTRLLILLTISRVGTTLDIVYQWGQLEFDYATPQERQTDIDSGLFTPGIFAPVDVHGYYKGINKEPIVYVTIPKFMTGVPASLGTVMNRTLNSNPIIKPYPDWSWHRVSGCPQNRIVSAFRVTTDKCGRLWVVDTGKVENEQVCPGQIIAFDLFSETTSVLHRYEFGSDINFLVTAAIDIGSSCSDTFVYIADSYGFQMFVYDLANNRSWRITDKTFYPYPNYGTFTVAGESFDLMDGIVGLALENVRVSGQDRKLFYHAMSSPTENWVYTSHLKNYSLFRNNASPAPEIFHTYRGKRNSQGGAQDLDTKYGVMFFGLMSKSQVACWNTKTPYGPRNIDIVAFDSLKLQFPIAVKVIENEKGQEEVWILSDRYQKIVRGTINPNVTNFRIFKVTVEELLLGSKCKHKHL